MSVMVNNCLSSESAQEVIKMWCQVVDFATDSGQNLENWSSRVEAHRFRPMASAVSALSSIVANGNQIVPTVPPPPRFIPYGGFSLI
jgi:hypothetical protein